jgi:uncharacterized GH25 family protein
MMNHLRAILFVTPVLLSASQTRAHDFWIEPSAFHLAVPGPLKIHFRVGDEFPGDAVPRNDQRIVQFVLLGPEQTNIADAKSIVGRDGEQPAGLTRIEKPGIFIIGYCSNHAQVTVDAATCEEYLKEKGLDEAIAARQANHQTNQPSNEIYSRCAKALVQCGPPLATDVDRSLGFTLELIALKNPYALNPGEDLPVLLLYEGKPAANRLVTARNSKHPETNLSVRTDSDGRASLKLAVSGMWVINAVHMIPAPAISAAPGASSSPRTQPQNPPQWESFWASLTFEMPDAAK